MTVITYSSADGRLPEEIHRLEPCFASRNGPETPSEILEAWSILEPWENPVLKSCGGKGQSWTKRKRGRENKGGASEEKLRGMRGTWSTEVSRERMETGGKKEQWNLRNGCKWEVGKEFKDNRKTGAEGENKGDCRSKADFSMILTLSGREDKEVKWKKRKSWDFFMRLENISKGKYGVKQAKKGMMKEMRCCHIFLWLPLLFLSLWPEAVSSQVSRAFESQFN